MDMTPELWRYIADYGCEVFGAEDEHLAAIMPAAIARGMPDIAVNAEVGRLLMMMTACTARELAIEVGTLAGYSAIWIARGLAPGGRLITIEAEPDHAAFAREQLDRAGVGDRVEVIVGAGLDVLPELATRYGPSSTDIVFLDAIKAEYPDYWRIVRDMIRPGGFILADNVYGSDWTIDDVSHPSRQGIDRFNRAVASDPDFEAVAIPLRQGVLIGRRGR